MSAIASLKMSERYLLWVAGNLSAATFIACLAFQLQQDGIAPAMLFPLLIGTLLGAAGLVMGRLTGIENRRWMLVAFGVLGLLVVVGQDYIGHRYRLRLYDDALGRENPLVAMAMTQRPEFRPRFDEFLAGVVREKPIWWALDLLLTTGAAVGVAALGIRGNRIAT